MKKIVIFLFMALSACSSNSINGIWERSGDEFQGMRIEIKKEGSSYIGIVIKLPDSGDDLFAVGDIKWKDISHQEKNKYHFKDLKKYENPLGSLFSNDYGDSYFVKSGNIISTRVFSKGDELVGTTQTWSKID